MKKCIKAALAFSVMLILLYAFHIPLLDRVGKALVRSDEIKPADGIVVLLGDTTGERMNGAIKLLKTGYGQYIVFCGGRIYWQINYSELMLRQLKANGVDKDKVVWSDEKLPEDSTYGEALVNLKLLKQKSARSFILVTSDYHSARAGRVYATLAAKHGMAMYVYPVQDQEIMLDGWWKHRNSMKMIFLEWQKTSWYYFKAITSRSD